ncbi:pseudaminic acid synthase [Grimontia hollisae]|uniref:N-acetylneuraminate synthase n=1 Tax=Grimontia hollisae CIP 101886 TaxID=675812 RepID=D0IBM4_GRIHO|nr:pseudaminic acid synthase [Grimontia hollisae]AMG29675.1 pseudaminic acid synthase [Grimontia hollisae]EEY71292.1 N-acetylneuraminate synthase [Grimontia hollisae CIP 101886]MDF2184256.1 pseudaminic acid synthase [Grimontia hollisae]STO43635.1 Spore coat polysaccharide biosynthesis protein spsE [Grimontia hollisae]
MTQCITINGRKIGPEHKPYIIAEMSANHNGSIERAFQTIEMAKRAGADAIKMQSYTADTITLNCDSEAFQIKGGLWDGRTLYDLYQEAHTPFEWHKPLFEKAREVGITLFSTPFDFTAVDLLEDLNVPAYKIASFEAVDLPLIRYVAQTGKPMIISTGMANNEEIAEAVVTARDNGCQQLVLLHCISAYPAPASQSHLRTIPDLAKRFGVISGLSDHTLGTTVSVAAIALGASVIEKHVTLSRNEPGPDATFSLEPDELTTLCKETETAWQALGQAGYQLKDAEKGNVQFRRSLYVVQNIKKGETLTAQNVRSIRPGLGLAPKHFDAVMGKIARHDIPRGTALSWDLIY